MREVRQLDDAAIERLQQRHGLDDLAPRTCFLPQDQAEATGSCPTIARLSSNASETRSAIGECVLTPFGAQVHAPWGMALQARLGQEWGSEIDLMWSDDGIVMRLPRRSIGCRSMSCCLTPMRSTTS